MPARRGKLGGVTSRPRRLPVAAWVAIGVVAAVVAIAAGVALGTATDDDRRATSVDRGDVAATTSTVPSTTAPPPPPAETTTSTTAATPDGRVPPGFYAILASADPTEAAGLDGIAAEVPGAVVVLTSSYDSVQLGDPALGQPPDHLPASGLAVVAVGPYSFDEAVAACANDFGDDCLVRQLREPG